MSLLNQPKTGTGFYAASKGGLKAFVDVFVRPFYK
jgi:hypothetical protein